MLLQNNSDSRKLPSHKDDEDRNKRGPRAVKVDYKRRDIYRYLLKQVPDIGVESSQHGRILNSFNKKISDLILTEALDFLMPARVGAIRILKYKPTIKIMKDGTLDTSNLSVDWQKTNKLWKSNPETKKQKKLIYFTNEHSEGYQYKWYFTNYRSNCINKTVYCFKPSRDNKRKLAQLIKDETFTGDYYM